MISVGNRPVPLASLTLGALALAIFCVAGPAPVSLVFDREAIARGEVWRLLTAHLVHTDGSHLIANLLGLAVLGALFERRAGAWVLLFLCSAATISGWLWFFRPEVWRYGGLSGVLYGFLAAGLARQWREPGKRLLVATVAVLVAGKSLFESMQPGSGMAHTSWPVLHGAHWVGAFAGLFIVLMRRQVTI